MGKVFTLPPRRRAGRGLVARLAAIALYPRSSALRRSFRNSAFAAQIDAGCGKALSDFLFLHAGAALIERMAGQDWLGVSARHRLAGLAEQRHARFVARYGERPFVARRRLYSEQVRHLPIGPAAAAAPEGAGRLCVVLHAYYLDTAEAILGKLRHLGRPFDLLVATPAQQVDAVAELCRRLLPGVPVQIVPARNRGRNFGPMLVEMAQEILGHDLLLHLHTKQSLRTGRVQAAWCNHILDHLVGSPEVVATILGAFAREPRLGLVGPFSFSDIPYWCHHWMSNAEAAERLFARLGVADYPRDGLLDFPAGGMFWARVEALRPLLAAGWDYEDFEPEPLPADGTLAHAIERGVTVVANAGGYLYGETDLETRTLRIGDSEKNVTAHFAATGDQIRTLFERADSVSLAFAGALFTPLAVHPQDVRAASAWLGTRAAAGSHGEALEHDLAAGVLKPREAVLALVRGLAAQGKHLLIVNDSGRDDAFVRAMLERQGLDGVFAQTLLPTPDGLVRPDGTLWQPVGEGVKGRYRHVHVGADPRTDLQYAANLGFQPMPAVDVATLADLRGALLPAAWRSRSHDWVDGVLLGPLVARIGNDPFGPSPASAFRFTNAREFGYCTLGPALAVLVTAPGTFADLPGMRRLRHRVEESDPAVPPVEGEAVAEIGGSLDRLLRLVLDPKDEDGVLAALREGAQDYVLDLVAAYGAPILAAPFDRNLAFATGRHWLTGRWEIPGEIRDLLEPERMPP
ncbi:rhamnan synthesis F family protein [Ancylobacter sp. 6x-1]|uniref:Rhamnan synthesis F family protein n=1 Tax=Ancylobacter crimeensis TaxID=2579147 RepID=A0ABT0D7Z6_9HYPH|nr:rhamnan synthesis F family protein [Ancylobacter crimeensis]MCK0196068.1 rhamnan synthesis F family protein [Ancylobacter crimeensis]